MTDQLSKLQLALLANIEANLAGMKLDYAIRMPDGTIHGDVDAVRGKKKNKAERTRAPLTFKYGEVVNYLRPQLSNLQPGQVVYVPYDKFGHKIIMSSVTSFVSREYGNGTYIAARCDVRQAVELLFHGGAMVKGENQ